MGHIFCPARTHGTPESARAYLESRLVGLEIIPNPYNPEGSLLKYRFSGWLSGMHNVNTQRPRDVVRLMRQAADRIEKEIQKEESVSCSPD